MDSTEVSANGSLNSFGSIIGSGGVSSKIAKIDLFCSSIDYKNMITKIWL